jgi:DNA-binding response OmpR family regulator
MLNKIESEVRRAEGGQKILWKMFLDCYRYFVTLGLKESTDELVTVDIIHDTVCIDGKVIHFSPRVFKLFLILYENEGKAVSNDEIMRFVWPESTLKSDDVTIRQFVRYVREKIEPDLDEFMYLTSVRSNGYMLSFRELRERRNKKKY